MSPSNDVDLENSKPIFLHALKLMVMHYNTKFGSLEHKKLDSSKYTICTNTDIMTFTLTLTLKTVFLFFLQDALTYDEVLSDQVWLPRNQQFRRYKRKSHYYILIKWALAVTLTLKIVNICLSAWHSGSWCCMTIPTLVSKCSAVQKIPSRWTFTNILNLCRHLDLEDSNLIFPPGTPAYNVVLPNQVWLQMDRLFSPRREAGDLWCLPPVWNLRAVIWFHFTISSLVLLPSPVTLPVLSFFLPACPFSCTFFF